MHISAPIVVCKSRIVLMCLFWTLCCAAVFWFALARGAIAAPAADQPGNNKDAVVKATLKNGLHVVIVPNRLAPVVTTVMNYHAGSNEAPADFPGMAHAQEHMMFRGSPALSAAQLSSISAAMGGDFNADTQQTVTQYFFTVPARYLDVALHIDSIRMRGVLDTQTLWSKERGAIEQEVSRDLSDPGYIVYRKILARMFRGTPYAQDALGTRPSFDKTTGEMLHKFYDNWYAPNNATLVITGSVDPDHVLPRVQELFGSIKRKKLPARPRFQLRPVKASEIQMPTDQPYGLAMLAFRMPGYQDRDYVAAQVLAQVLSSQRSFFYSRLVPTGKALGAEFDLHAVRPAGVGFAVVAFPNGKNANTLVGDVRGILKNIAADGVSDDLVAAAKRQATVQAEAQKDSIAGLAMQWSQALVVEGRDSPQDDERAIKRITAKEVDRVARRYLDQKHAIVAILTPRGSDQSIASSGFGGEETFTPSHVSRVKLPLWAARRLASLGPPESLIHPTTTKLANGLRLIVQPETTSRMIHIYGHIKNNASLETPPGKEGVDQVLDQLLDYGTDSLNRTGFLKALDQISAQESAGTNFSLDVIATHFARGMQLLADNELHPALPVSAFKVLRKQVADSVAGNVHSPDFHMQQAINAALYPKDDPTLRHALPQSVSLLRHKDIVQYYDRVFRPGLTTLVIVGNVQPQEAEQIVNKYFGGWRATGAPPPTELPPVPANKASTMAVPDSAKIQDEVVLAETLGLTRSNPDYYALKLGNQVLSGGFYASRLYSVLREQHGLVYYVQSAINAHKTRANLEIDYGSDPESVKQAYTLVTQALQQMQRSPVTEEELHRAQAELVRQVPLNEASEFDIGQILLALAQNDLPLDEPVGAARRYLELSAKDIQTAFKKWIRPGGLVQVSEGPAPK
jgi:zinc protease